MSRNCEFHKDPRTLLIVIRHLSICLKTFDFSLKCGINQARIELPTDSRKNAELEKNSHRAEGFSIPVVLEVVRVPLPALVEVGGLPEVTRECREAAASVWHHLSGVAPEQHLEAFLEKLCPFPSSAQPIALNSSGFLVGKKY